MPDMDRLREAVAYRDEHAPDVRLEASGGLTIEVARAVGETGVDWIAVGELTHSAPALDIGLEGRSPTLADIADAAVRFEFAIPSIGDIPYLPELLCTPDR